MYANFQSSLKGPRILDCGAPRSTVTSSSSVIEERGVVVNPNTVVVVFGAVLLCVGLPPLDELLALLLLLLLLLVVVSIVVWVSDHIFRCSWSLMLVAHTDFHVPLNISVMFF